MSDQRPDPIDRPIYWEPSLAFLKFAIAFLVVGSIGFLVTLRLYVPEQIERGYAVLGMWALAAAAAVLLWRGLREATVWTLAIGGWTYITMSSTLLGGVSGASVIVYPLIIVMVGWLIGTRAALVVAVATSIAMLGFVVAEMRGWLLAPLPTPPAMRWFIQTCVFITTAVAIQYLVRSYRNRLEDVRTLGSVLSRAQSVAQLGSWVYDLISDRMVLSAGACRIFGWPDGASPSFDDYLSRVPADDRGAVERDWRASLARGRALDLEHRVLVGTTVRWVRQIAEFEYQPDGTLVRCVGITQDVTDRRRNEAVMLSARAHLQATLDAIPDLLFEVDLDGRYLDWHSPRTDLLTVSPDQVIGRLVTDLLPPEPAAVCMSALREAHAHGRSQGKQYELALPQGRVWFEVSVSQKPVEPGETPRFIVLSRDITERKRAESELRERDNRLSAVFEASPLPIVVIRLADGLLMGINDAGARLYGRPRDVLIGQSVSALQIFADSAQRDDLMRQLGERGSVEGIPLEIRRSSGDVRLVEAYGRVIELDGQPSVVATLMDITERQQIEAGHLQAQKLESLGTLAGGIAHDFNNILSAIRGNADLAERDLGPDHRAAGSLGEIRKATSRAADLVRRIMVFGRPHEAGHEVVDLAVEVDEVLRLLRSTLPASLKLRTDFARDTPHVIADAGQVHEVVVNLTTNAAYAIGARPGSITYHLDAMDVADAPEHAIAGLAPGRYARLVVADTGCGMDESQLERIFDAFYTTKPVGEGTGLGLSMVHGIMKSHGGAVTAESALGTGSRFAVYFRVAASAANGVKVPGIEAGRTAPGRRVLFVDDEEALVVIAQELLSRFGHSVTAFTDSTDALERFRAQPNDFDVVVTDLSMPGLSGLDLAQAVLAVRPGMPIVLTTGWVRTEDEEAAREVGIRELVLKPISMVDLHQVIDRLLRADT